MRPSSYLASFCLRLVCVLLFSFAIIRCEQAKAQTVAAGPLKLSQAGYDLILYYEVGGKAYYESRLYHPTWPGGASGVTIGVGYDLGYNTREQIAKDWASLGPVAVASLQTVAGIKGQAARVAVARVRHIVVPWTVALDVFQQNTLSRFGVLTANAFPAAVYQHEHGQGALVSLSFNRGTSMEGESRKEMRWIRYNLVAHPEWVPGDIRAMKRLWIGKGLDGLLVRRDAEAALFQRGLDAER